MTTNKFLPSAGNITILNGSYNYGQARMWIPEESVITAGATYVGEVRTISSSGAIVIWDGSVWKKFQMSGVAPIDTGVQPNHPSISGSLYMWVDATAEAFTLTGSGVDDWKDNSGRGYGLDDNDSTPRRGDDGGVSGVFFDGSNDLCIQNTNTHPAIDITATDQPFTIVMAYRSLRAASGNLDVLWTIGSSTVNVIHFFGSIEANDTIRFASRDSASLTINAYANQGGPIIDHRTSPQVTSWMKIGTGTATQAAVYTSGAPIFTAMSGQNMGTMTSAWTTLGGLNRFGFGKSNWFNGVIYSCAIFNSGLSSEDRKGVERWMAYKYGAPMLETYEDNL